MTSTKLASAFHGKISFDSILQAHERVKNYLHCTPVFQNETLDLLCRSDSSSLTVHCKGLRRLLLLIVLPIGPVEWKLPQNELKWNRFWLLLIGEFLQKTGSFKSRGALNSVIKLRGRWKGSCTYASVRSHCNLKCHFSESVLQRQKPMVRT